MAPKSRTLDEVVTREYTINVHKRIHGQPFKRRARRAVSEIRKFAAEQMGTSDVRISTDLNQHIWSKGVRNVPRRVRVRFARLRNQDDQAKEKLYTLVSYVPCPSFKGLQTFNVTDDE
eukprot:Awhi_evm1s4554